MNDNQKSLYKNKIWMVLISIYFFICTIPIYSPFSNIIRYYNENNLEIPNLLRLFYGLIIVVIFILVVGLFQRKKTYIKIAKYFFIIVLIFPFIKINNNFSIMLTLNGLIYTFIFFVPNILCSLYLFNPAINEIIKEYEDKRAVKRNQKRMDNGLLK